ncbi:MAG: hypothetical protein KF858_06850 [Candidatus Sumerlaeia bacterium]|nr:hypothetical protein [Candidatus Sumerlaeia bacterium]
MTADSRVIYSLTVPSTPESLMVLEGLGETFLTASDSVPDDIALILRLSVAEACRNALACDAPADRLNLTTLTFVRLGPAKDVRGIGLEIRDSGTGLPIDGHRPPYPDHMVGKEYILAELLDQHVVAKVADPWSLKLSSREVNSRSAGRRTREAILAETGERGLGLLALCRCWSLVRFTHDPERGTTVRLEGATLTA